MFVNLYLRRCFKLAMVLTLLGFGHVCVAEETSQLNVAEFNEQGQLLKPATLDEWIHLGSNVGHGYDEGTFDPKTPGTFHIVEIEPSAYAYVKQHGQYADGTMLALSFYKVQEKTNLRLNGLSQGELVSFEIHLIDSKKYEDGRAFFNFGLNDQANAAPSPNRCVECHREEGAFASTFTQFYPKMQKILNISR